MNRLNGTIIESKSSTAHEEIQKTRVIGIYAHIDAGKTTTSEAILYDTGRIHRVGSVDEGNTTLDWMEQERERGITITAAATTCTWRGCPIHLIDTPGHIDFTVEVMRSIRVIDGAVMVLCGVGGVETQTETVWRYAEGHNLPRRILPRLIFVNKLDRDAADFERVVAEIRTRLTPHAVPLQIPLGCGDTFHGMIDLLEQHILIWSEEKQGGEQIQPIPPALAEQAAAARSTLVDAICETDEALLAQRIEGGEPDLPALRAALRQATVLGLLVPVLCGSARKHIGVQPLLDAIVDYLPSPVDMPALSGPLPDGENFTTRSPSPAEPFCATVFKIVTDPHVGHLAWTRVFSGELNTGDTVYNPRTEETERAGRIYQIHANRRENAGYARPGDVVALVGVKSAVTGDTLCHPGAPIVLEPFHFPEPVISVALSPTSEEERDKLSLCATRLCEEDPTLKLSFDAETGEQIISGMGELHLEITVDRLRSEYGVIAKASPFQIAYRETALHKSEATGAYRKQSGGHGHFAMVRVRVDPLPRGEGLVVRSRANPVELPEQYSRAAEGGIREALEKGVVAGYPITDVRITIIGGKYHEIDSNSMDFRIAGSMAVRQALKQSGAVLLEPIMQADIRLSEEYLKAVMADFLRRRGSVSDLQIHGSTRILLGEVPLAEARGYASVLRNATQGRGSFTLELRRYDPVPDHLAEQIIEQRQAAGKITVR